MDYLLARFISVTIDFTPLPGTDASASKLQTGLNIVFTIMGSVALLVITVAGLRYVLSHGDPNAIAQAKKAIIYALVGLAVTATAFGIVEFVIKGV